MMNKHALRNALRILLHAHFRRELAAGEGYFGPLPAMPEPRRATVYQEMHLGSSVGVIASLAYAWALGAPALVIALAGLAGYGVGAVIGLVLWSGSDNLPEDRIRPPARGKER